MAFNFIPSILKCSITSYRLAAVEFCFYFNFCIILENFLRQWVCGIFVSSVFPFIRSVVCAFFLHFVFIVASFVSSLIAYMHFFALFSSAWVLILLFVCAFFWFNSRISFRLHQSQMFVYIHMRYIQMCLYGWCLS